MPNAAPARQTMKLPFTRPAVMGREREYVAEAIGSQKLSGDGPFTARCHALLQQRLGVPSVLLTTSCTHALELAALLLNIREGDEVIVPSFTFVSTINAFVLRGARPVFIDSRPDTLNLDERQLEQLITPRTKAIVVMHYAGVACEMDVILQIASAHGIAVVEDNAHGLFGKYRGRWLGTLGDYSTLSFHETKNFSCGEGGALLISDPRNVERAEILREKGTDRSRFYRGQIDKYTWVDVGSSYLPSELLAAFLFGQLESEQIIQARRRQIWERYHRELQSWGAQHGALLPVVPEYCEQSWHLYFIRVTSLERRQALMAHLAARGVPAPFHYQPLHLSTMGLTFGGAVRALPVVEAAADQLLRLPLYNDMTDADVDLVVHSLLSW